MTTTSLSATLLPTTSLPAAPASVLDTAGQVHFGKYAGTPTQVDWTALAAPHRRSRIWQRFHQKRWQYVALITDDIFCGIAIIDLGWSSTAFVYVFDRRRRMILANFSQDGIPGLSARINAHPAEGAASNFRSRSNRIDYQHVPDSQQYTVDVRCANIVIEARFDAQAAAPFLTALGEADGGTVHGTVKSSGMPSSGKVTVDKTAFDLAGGIANIDHSNGFLPRETAWRCAFAHNLELGFNLHAGHFGSNENALWIDGQIIALSNVHFIFDPSRPLEPWHIYTNDGLLDLQFQPEGCHNHNKDLLVAASRHAQTVGTFTGWIKASADAPPRSIERLTGITEDRFAL
jgi:hypothetical protein